MKKLFLTFLVFLAAVCLCTFGLTACDQGSDNREPEIGDAPTDIIIYSTSDYIQVSDIVYADGYNRDSEIKLDDGEWIEFDNRYVFDNLTAGSTYTVYARARQNGSVLASEPFSKQVTLNKRQQNEKPEVSLKVTDGKTVEIVGFTDQMEAQFELRNPQNKTSGTDGFTDSGKYSFTENGRITVLVRFKESDTTLTGQTVSLTAYATDFAGGTGSKEDPFLIETYEQLVATGNANYRYMPNNAHFRLENDIECPQNQKPISESSNYSVYIDGNNKKIKGLNISEAILPETFNMYAGLFEQISGVENLNIEDAKIAVKINEAYTSTDMGIIAGRVHEYVKNCKVSGTLEYIVSSEGEDFREDSYGYSEYLFAGGLAGKVNGDIEGCRSDVKITLPDSAKRNYAYSPYCGGLVGSCYGNISLSSAELIIYGGTDGGSNVLAVCNGGRFGGLIGNGTKDQSIENSYASARMSVKLISPYSTVSITPSYFGGLIGYAENTAIKNSYATFLYAFETENQKYSLNAGGLTGGSVAVLENCFVDTWFFKDGFDKLKTDEFAITFDEEVRIVNCYYSEGKTTAAGEGATAVRWMGMMDNIDWQKEHLNWDKDIWEFHDYRLDGGNIFPTLK